MKCSASPVSPDAEGEVHTGSGNRTLSRIMRSFPLCSDTRMVRASGKAMPQGMCKVPSRPARRGSYRPAHRGPAGRRQWIQSARRRAHCLTPAKRLAIRDENAISGSSFCFVHSMSREIPCQAGDLSGIETLREKARFPAPNRPSHHDQTRNIPQRKGVRSPCFRNRACNISGRRR